MILASTKTIVTNVVVTFFQAALAVLAVSNWDFTNKTALAGAVGAGASAVWNLVLKPWAREKGWL